MPAVRNKTGVDLVRPLSRAAQVIIAALPKAGEFVWSTHGGAVPIGGFAQFKRRFDAASGTDGWAIHDLRRTARSLMSRAGVPTDHAEKRQAFEALAALIERIVTGTQSSVVQLRGKR